jgi:hypothetical protein
VKCEVDLQEKQGIDKEVFIPGSELKFADEVLKGK